MITIGGNEIHSKPIGTHVTALAFGLDCYKLTPALSCSHAIFQPRQ